MQYDSYVSGSLTVVSRSLTGDGENGLTNPFILAWFPLWKRPDQPYALLPVVPRSRPASPASVISLPDSEYEMVQSYGVVADHDYAPEERQGSTAASPLLGASVHRSDNQNHEDGGYDGGHASISSCVGNLCNTIMGKRS